MEGGEGERVDQSSPNYLVNTSLASKYYEEEPQNRSIFIARVNGGRTRERHNENG